jgi:hypothetical protein
VWEDLTDSHRNATAMEVKMAKATKKGLRKVTAEDVKIASDGDCHAIWEREHKQGKWPTPPPRERITVEQAEKARRREEES